MGHRNKLAGITRSRPSSLVLERHFEACCASGSRGHVSDLGKAALQPHVYRLDKSEVRQTGPRPVGHGKSGSHLVKEFRFLRQESVLAGWREPAEPTGRGGKRGFRPW